MKEQVLGAPPPALHHHQRRARRRRARWRRSCTAPGRRRTGATATTSSATPAGGRCRPATQRCRSRWRCRRRRCTARCRSPCTSTAIRAAPRPRCRARRGARWRPQGFAVIGFTDILNRELSAGITDEQQAILAQVAPVLAASSTRARGARLLGRDARRADRLPAHSSTVSATLDVLPIGAPDGVPDLDADRAAHLPRHQRGRQQRPGLPAVRAGDQGRGRWSPAARAWRGADPPAADQLFLTVLGALFPSMTPTDIWVGVSLFQHIYDRQDPHNHAPLPLSPSGRGGRHDRASASVLLLEGLDDTLVPNHATDSLAWSLGRCRTWRRCSARCRSSTSSSGPLQRQHRRRYHRRLLPVRADRRATASTRRPAARCCRRASAARATTAPRAPPSRSSSARSSSRRRSPACR